MKQFICPQLLDIWSIKNN